MIDYETFCEELKQKGLNAMQVYSKSVAMAYALLAEHEGETVLKETAEVQLNNIKLEKDIEGKEKKLRGIEAEIGFKEEQLDRLRGIIKDRKAEKTAARYGKKQVFECKQTDWIGLWWHQEYQCFSSSAINLSVLNSFKGCVRIYAKKNPFYNNGQNGRPNYTFCIKDARGGEPVSPAIYFSNMFWDIAGREEKLELVKENLGLYDYDELQSCIRQAAVDGQNGYTDVIVSDYIEDRSVVDNVDAAKRNTTLYNALSGADDGDVEWI